MVLCKRNQNLGLKGGSRARKGERAQKNRWGFVGGEKRTFPPADSTVDKGVGTLLFGENNRKEKEIFILKSDTLKEV